MTSGNFRITNPPTGIFSPAADESWESGSTQVIRWKIYTTDRYAKIFISINDEEWGLIAHCTNSGSYSWIVQGVISNECYIKVMETGDEPIREGK